MGDDAIQCDNYQSPQPPARKRRRGDCLGWTCGCLAGLAVIVVTIGLLFGLLLNRWDTGESAWENLPPGTDFAVEVHDLRNILRRGFADPGLLRILDKHYLAFQQSLAILEGRQFASQDLDSLHHIAANYRRFGFLHRIFLPNNAVLFGSVRHPGETGLIAQAPVWLRWLFYFDDPGQIRLFEDADAGTHFYYTHRDNWLILGLSEEILKDTLDHWDSRAKPLGPRVDGDAARVYAAVRPESGGGDAMDGGNGAVDSAAVGEPGHFAFADPFAAATAEIGKLEHEEKLDHYRLLIRPMQPEFDGWGVYGEAGGRELFTASGKLMETVAAKLRGMVPQLQYMADFSAFFRVAPDVMEAWRIKSARLARDASFSEDRYRSDLAWKWLHDTWFAKMNGDGWLGVKAPVLPKELIYPPLPVVTLAWGLRDGEDAGQTGKEFNQALDRWLGGARSLAGPGSELRDSEHFGAHFHDNSEGVGGELRLPPVMVNGARLVWQFYRSDRTGWLATDPAGLPAKAGELNWPSGSRPEVDDGCVATVGSWRVTPVFMDSLADWFRDRYATLPPKRRLVKADAEKLDDLADHAREFFQSFPTGSFGASANVKGDRVLFKVFVAKGVGE